MPLIFWIPIAVFAMTAARSSNSHVPVFIVSQDGTVQERSVLKPLIVVEEEGYVSVRSGFALKGEYVPPLQISGNALIRDFNDRAFYFKDRKE